MKYIVSAFPEGTGNGDVAIKTDKGRLVALVYAQHLPRRTEEFASVIADALNSTFSPGMTDLMVDPQSLDRFLQGNPLPDDIVEDGRKSSASLIAEMASQHPWKENARDRMVLKIAERAVLRGRLLTEEEKLSNMADFLLSPSTPS